MRTRGLVVLCAVAVSLSGCSLIVGNGKECTQDSDCPGGRTCAQQLCVELPHGCTGNADAGVLAVYGPVDAGNAIHFGAVLGLSTGGGASTTEFNELRAMVLALEEINQRSGVSARPFVLHVCDTGDDDGPQTTAQAEAKYLAEQVHVPAMIVSTSPRVIAVAPSMVAHGVLVMSATATSTEVTALADSADGGIGLVWRTAPSDAIQGQVINELLRGTGAYDAGLATVSKVGVAYSNDPYGQGLNGILVAGLAGAKAEQSFQFDPSVSLAAPAQQLASYQPDLTVLVAFPEDAPRFITAAAADGLTRASGHQWFFTDGSKDPALVANSPPGEVEGSYGTGPAQGAGPAYSIFRSSYISRYSSDPNSYAFLEYNYDAMYTLALASAVAVGPAGTDAVTGARIAEGLTHLESGAMVTLGPSQFTNAVTTLRSGGTVDVEGASGHLTFDVATGDVTAPIEIWQVDGGTIQHVVNVEP